MLASGLVTTERLRDLYEYVEPQLYRYPAIDPADFRRRLDAVHSEWDGRYREP